MLPDNVLDFLSVNNGRILATGSRVICDPAPTNTDEDWVVYVHNYRNFRTFLQDNGWATDDSYDSDRDLFGDEINEDHAISDEGFCSFKKDHLNIILVANNSTFNKWVTATSLATHLNLLDKNSRVQLFSDILYGTGLFGTDRVELEFSSENRVSSIFSRLYITTVSRR